MPTVTPAHSPRRLVPLHPPQHLRKPGNGGLFTALYDAVATHLGVPIYSLLGEKHRDWVPCAAWTRPASPADLKVELRRAVDQGYMALKMHTSPHFDLLQQLEAAEEVTPPGFKLHLDMNHNRSLAAVLPIIKELETHPIVAFIEDPLPYDDVDGWRTLRAETKIPLIMQGVPIPPAQMLQLKLADVYMLGHDRHGSVADIMAFGWACASANTPVILQETGGGGMIGKAMSLHMAAALQSHSAHMICLEDQCEATHLGSFCVCCLTGTRWQTTNQCTPAGSPW